MAIRFLPLMAAMLLPSSLAAQEEAAQKVAAPAPQASAITLVEARASTIGNWSGELQYLDYQSGDWIGIPVSIETQLIADGVTLLRRAIFDDGPQTGWVYITSTHMLARDGSTEYVGTFRADRPAELGSVQLRLSEASDANNWTIVAKREGQDDNRPALIRETTRRAGDELVTLKEVDFLDDEAEQWLTRNRFVLTRQN